MKMGRIERLQKDIPVTTYVTQVQYWVHMWPGSILITRGGQWNTHKLSREIGSGIALDGYIGILI